MFPLLLLGLFSLVSFFVAVFDRFDFPFNLGRDVLDLALNLPGRPADPTAPDGQKKRHQAYCQNTHGDFRRR